MRNIGPKTYVRTAKGRKLSSKLWLERQLNDPYVRQAKAAGYRSRAAFKILELDQKLKLFRPGLRVVDLGAAPGGWSQVAAAKGCSVVALDLLPMDPIPGVAFLQRDFTDNDAPNALKAALGGKAGLVLSDIAPNTTGHKATDHLRIMAMAEMAYDFAREVLEPGGAFIAKVFQGGTEGALLTRMKRDFRSVRHLKPPASRKDSAEHYVAAIGFRGESGSDSW